MSLIKAALMVYVQPDAIILFIVSIFDGEVVDEVVVVRFFDAYIFALFYSL